MNQKDEEFNKRLQATFKIEAEEHLRAISSGFIDLEKKLLPGALKKVIEDIFREAHSLKGAARAVGLKKIEFMCQALESVFSALKHGELALSEGLFDLFHSVSDAVSALVASADKERSSEESAKDRELISRLSAVLPGKQSASTEKSPGPAISIPAEKPALREKETKFASKEIFDGVQEKARLPLSETRNIEIAKTIRIAVSRLDPLLEQAEEMLQVKMADNQRTAELKEIKQTLAVLKAGSTNLNEKLSSLTIEQRAEQQEKNEILIAGIQNRLNSLITFFERDHRRLSRLVDEQLASVKQMLMMPVSSLLEGFPKFTRDLSHDRGKETELIISGSELELEKHILEELKDPLIHILRNCIDHGIEKPGERRKRNKTPAARIIVSFMRKEGNKAEILISDDGAGIDAEKVCASAIKSGVITKERAAELDRQDKLDLVFMSGVSTSPFITDISGRGLGLAIVKEKIGKLGGTIQLETKVGSGTTFRMLLPLTLSTFRGIPAKVDGQVFVFPANNVKQCIRVKQEEVRTVENRLTIKAGKIPLSAVKLGEALNLSRQESAKTLKRAHSTGYLTALIISSENSEIAFLVDEVLGEQQFLIKGFGPQLMSVRNFTGATIFENGTVVPVLNINDLVESAVKIAEAGSAGSEVEEISGKKGRILVAEDSITSRTLLKNILETAGYLVTTAVDGADAFAQVKAGEYDLVVSDVDMPRLSGFELTAKIRADKKLGDLPIVLVTALESREDKERGIDAGANAYIIKSSFDQSNLLEVISRLI